MVLLSLPNRSPSPDTGDWQALLEQADQSRAERRYHEALQLSDRAAQSGSDARYQAALLRGDILLELGDALAALSSYDSVADPAQADPDLDCARGLALFELARFAEAELALASALRGRPDLADAHQTLGLISEIRGTGREVDHFRRARRLAPDRYPVTPFMSLSAFDELVDRALEGLPHHVAAGLRSTGIRTVEVPGVDLLREAKPAIPPTSLGMFVAPLKVTLKSGVRELRGAEIVLFKRNLERAFGEPEALCQAIRRTVLFEISRVLGIRTVGLVSEPRQDN